MAGTGGVRRRDGQESVAPKSRVSWGSKVGKKQQMDESQPFRPEETTQRYRLRRQRVQNAREHQYMSDGKGTVQAQPEK